MSRPPHLLRATLAVNLSAVAIALGGCFSSGPSPDAPSVTLYCEYGAVSKAQLHGCETHVPLSQIRRLATDAARFGKGQLERCLDTAGPFCRNQ